MPDSSLILEGARSFGVSYEYMIAACLFIFLHVQTIKSLWPGVSSLGTLISVFVVSVLYHLTDIFPGFGSHYKLIMLPTIYAMGSWHTAKSLISKIKE